MIILTTSQSYFMDSGQDKFRKSVLFVYLLPTALTLKTLILEEI